MFNTCRPLANYVKLDFNIKYVTVANGSNVPVEGYGTCGILKKGYLVSLLSHNLLIITTISFPLAITKVSAMSTDSDFASAILLQLLKPLSPHAVPFVPRSSLLLRTGETFTAPLSPPPSPTFRAGRNLSPSHKGTTKDDNWEAWRTKRKKNQYRPPLSTSHQTKKSKLIPVTTFIC